MTNETAGQAGPADRYDRASAILAAYPNINDAELQELKLWFDKASLQDETSIARDERLADNYRQFRADHLDRLSPKDWLKGLIGLLIVLGCIAGIGLLAPH